MADDTLKKRADQQPAERGLALPTEQHILQAVKGIQYGSVQLVMQGGRVAEIRLDKEAFLRPRAAANGRSEHWRLANTTTQG